MSTQRFNGKIDFRVAREPWVDEAFTIRAICVSDLGGKRSLSVLQGVLAVKVTPDEACCEVPALLTLDREEAQKLMNELWDAGVRPRDVGTAGQLAATERHLGDMRRLVFEAKGLNP